MYERAVKAPFQAQFAPGKGGRVVINRKLQSLPATSDDGTGAPGTECSTPCQNNKGKQDLITARRTEHFPPKFFF